MTQRKIGEPDVATGRGLLRSAWFPAPVLVLTVAQLAVAEYVPGIERFADKAFGARLIAYPVMMLFVPAVWWLVQRRRATHGRGPPYLAFGLIGLPFLIDVTGNSLDLYDTVGWWDDFNHFVNWVFLCLGLALVIAPRLRPAWVLVTLVTGLRLPARARLGARRVVHLHPPRHRARHGLRGHPRRHDARHARLAGRRVARAAARPRTHRWLRRAVCLS